MPGDSIVNCVERPSLARKLGIVPLDDDYHCAVIRCVQRNPVRSVKVRKAEGYRWPGAGGHGALWPDVLATESHIGASSLQEHETEPGGQPVETNRRGRQY